MTALSLSKSTAQNVSLQLVDMDHFHILSQAILSFVCRRSLNPKYRHLKTYVRNVFKNAQYWIHL
jgi:hypothetical protein